MVANCLFPTWWDSKLLLVLPQTIFHSSHMVLHFLKWKLPMYINNKLWTLSYPPPAGSILITSIPNFYTNVVSVCTGVMCCYKSSRQHLLSPCPYTFSPWVVCSFLLLSGRDLSHSPALLPHQGVGRRKWGRRAGERWTHTKDRRPLRTGKGQKVLRCSLLDTFICSLLWMVEDIYFSSPSFS